MLLNIFHLLMYQDIFIFILKIIFKQNIFYYSVEEHTGALVISRGTAYIDGDPG